MHVWATIGFGFTSDWLKKWRENFEPITEWSNAKPLQFVNYFRHSIENRFKNPLTVRSDHYVNSPHDLKVPLWKKITSFFFFRFWKCVCLTLDWQNFELWFLFKSRLLRVLVLPFTVRHYSRSKLTDWTSKVGSREKWRQRLTSLKFQRVNAAYYIYTKNEFKSLKAQNSRAAY